MSITPVHNRDAFQALVRALSETVDANKDGTISTSEFSLFLEQVLADRAAGDRSGRTAPAAAATTGAIPGTTSATGGAAPRLEGFDDRKLADTTHNTVKYRFARVAAQYDLSSVTDKASAEQLLRAMVDDLQRSGLTVNDVRGDKLQLVDDTGTPIWIDVIRGASSGDPAFQWLPLDSVS